MQPALLHPHPALLPLTLFKDSPPRNATFLRKCSLTTQHFSREAAVLSPALPREAAALQHSAFPFRAAQRLQIRHAPVNKTDEPTPVLSPALSLGSAASQPSNFPAKQPPCKSGHVHQRFPRSSRLVTQVLRIGTLLRVGIFMNKCPPHSCLSMPRARLFRPEIRRFSCKTAQRF